MVTYSQAQVLPVVTMDRIETNRWGTALARGSSQIVGHPLDSLCRTRSHPRCRVRYERLDGEPTSGEEGDLEKLLRDSLHSPPGTEASQCTSPHRSLATELSQPISGINGEWLFKSPRRWRDREYDEVWWSQRNGI